MNVITNWLKGISLKDLVFALKIFLIFNIFFSIFSFLFSKEFREIPSKNVCDGLPNIPVTTMKGFCLGLVMNGFEFPRGILPLKNDEILVVDMGSWQPKKGSLWKVVKKNGIYKKFLLLRGLDRPHAIIKSPDGLIYIANADRLSILKIDFVLPFKISTTNSNPLLVVK